MSAAVDSVGVAEFPGLKRCESPLGHRWWAYGTNNDDEYPLGDYVPAAWLSDAQRERDEARATVAKLIEADRIMRTALARLVAESVHPYDGGEYEDGEWEALDLARAALARVGGAS